MSDTTTPQALDVITVGEAMALFMAAETGPLARVQHFNRVPAGAELNVAVGLSRLGFRVGYISRVGRDSFGEHLLAFMDEQGIDRRCVRVDDFSPTGFMLKSLQTDGSDPKTEYFRRGSAASRLGATDHDLVYCAASRHLHLTGICPALSNSLHELVVAMAEQARIDERRVSFDPNLRPALWSSQRDMIKILNQLAASADLVLPGMAEGQLLTGFREPRDIAHFYLDRGASQVVVKLGEAGAYFASADGEGVVPGHKVPKVVDTVGAGDGFAVGVISALLEGLSLQEAAARGNAIGARVVQFPGDSDGLPNREQLCELTQPLA